MPDHATVDRPRISIRGESSWKDGSLADVISDVRGGFSVNSEDRTAEADELGVLKTGAVLKGRFEPEENKVVLPHEAGRVRTSVSAGKIILCRKNSAEVIGASALVNENHPNLFLSDLLWQITPAEGVSGQWLSAVLASDHVRNLIRISSSGTQASMRNISQDRLLAIAVPIPPLSEQRKIASILGAWDEALETLAALRVATARKSDAVRLKLFEAEYASHSRLRRARDLFESVSERARPELPLLAVMQDVGVVRRDELERRVAMPDGETSAYKVVRPGDFVISLRSFEGGLEYSRILGLVSPAYTVLRPVENLAGEYYRHFFKSTSFIGRLDKLIFGIRDGKQIAFRDFGDMLIPSPPLGDQTKHGAALGTLEAELALIDRQIEALARQKRGLVQKLLTGQWPVKVNED